MAQVSVLTQHNDISRTGQNLNETVLNTSNVNVGGFGKLFWRTVDGMIYAQPLYVPGLNIQGKTRNVVYVATQHNSVYAFDADDPTQATPLWQVNLGTPVPSQDICIVSGDTNPGDCPYLDINPEVGITSTPVIDPLAGTAGIIYVVAKTKRTSDSTYHFFLHALDLIAGTEQLGGPTEITGQVPGSGAGSSDGVLAFSPLFHLQRPGLLWLNGVIYIAFGSCGDIGTFHGWLMAYDASTLQQIAIFSTTPNGTDGGIWQSGVGLVGDAGGNVYAMTGNGDFTANTSGKDYGDSFVKFGTANGLSVSDYFTPADQATLFSGNEDLGAGGPVAIPGTTLLAGIGKDKIFRVVDSTNMGGYNSAFDSDVQSFTAANSPYFGAATYWDSPNNGPVVYLWGPKDFLKAYKYTGGLFLTTPVTQSTVQSSTGFSNAAALSLSADGSLLGSGIVWSLASLSGVATGPAVPGIVRAFDATNLGTELWDSRQNAVRDDVGLYAKFNPPTVANGKVYVGSFSGQLLVYGLAPPATSGIQFVQVASATPGTSAASVPVAYPSAQGAGDLNVVVVSWSDTTSTIQSVTDSLGNAYTLAVGPTTGTGQRQSIYYAKNIITGSNTVTVAFNQAAASPDVRVLEYSGVDTVAPLDVTIGASGNSSTANSGSATLTNANDLIIGANIVGAKNIVAGSPFTPRALTSTNSNIVEDRVVNVAGSYYAWSPMVSAAPWVMQMVAFKAGTSTSGTAPSVGGVSPTSGTAAGGTAVTITGSNFAAGATASFGGVLATNVVVVSSTSITATTPAHAAGAVTVTVTNPNGQSGGLVGAYTFTSIGGGTISFVQVKSATPQTTTASVPITYPAAQTAGDLNIVAVGWNDTTSTVSGVTDSRGNTYTLAIGPTTGTGLRQSIYYAKNIAAGSNTVTVTFNKAAAFPDVRVLEYSGLDTSNPLDVTAGAAGTGTAASSGTATTTSATELIFGAGMTLARFTGAGSGFTSRIITSPDADIAEDEVVSATGSYSAAAPNSSSSWVMQMATFILASAPTPTVTGIGPSTGPTSGGTSVTITGTNFAAGATVTFGANAATNVTVLNSATITASTPAGGVGAVTVTVTNSTGRSGSLSSAFTYTSANPAPTVSSISPNTGPIAGETGVTITGTGFLSGATVTLGGNSATGVTVVSSTSITATSPAHAAGAVNVVVTNTDAQSGTLTNGYSYTNPAPTVTSITPNSGTTAGGTSVTIRGTGFLSGATVSLGGTAATSVTVVSATSITAKTPAHAAGAVNVVVTNTDAQSGTLTNGYTYTTANPAPTVTLISPNSGTTAGGTAVTITGTGFLSGATVSLGGTAATGVTVVSATSITAKTPAHASGAVNVVVTNTDAQSGTLTNGYTYTSSGGGGSIAFVQVKSATPQTASASVAVTFTTAQTLGNLNIVVVGWNDTTSTVSTVTDNRGNTYTLAIGPTTGTGLRQSIYYAKNIAAGTNTVTVTFNKAAAFVDIRALEYSGLDPTSPLDQTAGAAGSGTTASSGAATTASANELIFGAGMTATAFTGAGTGFVSRIITTPDADIAEDRTVAATGSYSATAPNKSSNWVMQMVTLKAHP
ncbi:MAG: IPT/TIG domain-containing protein [Terriglobales bacterium]